MGITLKCISGFSLCNSYVRISREFYTGVRKAVNLEPINCLSGVHHYEH